MSPSRTHFRAIRLPQHRGPTYGIRPNQSRIPTLTARKNSRIAEVCFASFALSRSAFSDQVSPYSGASDDSFPPFWCFLSSFGFGMATHGRPSGPGRTAYARNMLAGASGGSRWKYLTITLSFSALARILS